MKKTQELEDLKKMDTKELGLERDKLRIEITQKICLLAESGRKNSLEIKILKRKVARIETIVLQKMDEEVAKHEVQNVK